MKTALLPLSAALAMAALASVEQFIPDKTVVIHPAVESPPVRQGAMKGPGTALGATPPTPPAARGGRARAGRKGGPPPIPPPPPAPEINAAGAAVEQTAQGKRAAHRTRGWPSTASASSFHRPAHFPAPLTCPMPWWARRREAAGGIDIGESRSRPRPHRRDPERQHRRLH